MHPATDSESSLRSNVTLLPGEIVQIRMPRGTVHTLTVDQARELSGYLVAALQHYDAEKAASAIPPAPRFVEVPASLIEVFNDLLDAALSYVSYYGSSSSGELANLDHAVATARNFRNANPQTFGPEKGDQSWNVNTD